MFCRGGGGTPKSFNSYSEGCTGAVQSELVQCKVNWYSAGCPGTGQSVLVQWKVY